MSVPTITQLRSAVVAAINAGGFGVTAVPTWRGVRRPQDLETLTVEVVVTGIIAEAETSITSDVSRIVTVLVRHKLDDPDDVAGADAVAILAESIGAYLMSIDLGVEADPMALELDPVIDAEVLNQFSIAEAAASVTYTTHGA